MSRTHMVEETMAVVVREEEAMAVVVREEEVGVVVGKVAARRVVGVVLAEMTEVEVAAMVGRLEEVPAVR